MFLAIIIATGLSDHVITTSYIVILSSIQMTLQVHMQVSEAYARHFLSLTDAFLVAH